MMIYPLVFVPIFKDRIWGGSKLKTVLNKNIPNTATGESWELSDVSGDVSVVANGNLKGKTLTEIIQTNPEALLGTKVYQQFGKQFPLLFKYLDANADLSIQVHPNDDLAKQRHNSFGKTEMWYIMQAEENAEIIVGFKEDSNKEIYLKNLQNKSVTTILDAIKVKEGDVFFLETGTVHAIGAGLLVAEIQQTSDITYRIYDFDRKDANGNTRDLHTELAVDAINYKKTNTQKGYLKIANQSNKMVECPYFTTNFVPLHGEILVSKQSDSFTVYMCTEGSFTIDTNTETHGFKKGDTVLIPACLTNYTLSGEATILEIYI